MTNTFNCPTCGAPLDYAGIGETIRCPFCNNSVIVPAELRPTAHSTDGLNAAGMQGHAQVSQNAELMKGVAVLAQAGKTIEAIKLYRQMTNCGLAEAKAAVDNLRAGQPVQASQAFNAAQVENPTFASIPADQKAEILRLIQTHQKIEAIKLYRLKTGVGLKEAKDAVEAIDPGGQLKPAVKSIKAKILQAAFGLLFLGIASIFPITFMPMILSSWQQNQTGSAIGTIIGVAVWMLVWGGIGCLILFFV